MSSQSRPGEINLERVKIACGEFLIRDGLVGPASDLKISAIDHERYLGEKAGYCLSTYILGMGRETQTADAAWPRDWWEAFKQRWFPKWALARWPVKFERFHQEFTTYAKVCPHLHEASRDAHLRFFYEENAWPRRYRRNETLEDPRGFCALCGAAWCGSQMLDTMGQPIVATKCQGPWHHHNPPYLGPPPAGDWVQR